MRLPKVNRRAAEIVGAMILTTVVLFGLQEWYRSYMAIAHAEATTATAGLEASEVFAEQHRQLTTDCQLPIDQAMRRFATTDRNALSLIRPEVSTDVGPAAGWAHHPRYEPIGEMPEYVPEPEPEPLDVPVDEEGEEGAPTTAPAPAPAPRPTMATTAMGTTAMTAAPMGAGPTTVTAMTATAMTATPMTDTAMTATMQAAPGAP